MIIFIQFHVIEFIVLVLWPHLHLILNLNLKKIFFLSFFFVIQWVTCHTMGHMSYNGSHVIQRVTCHTMGHMSHNGSHVTHFIG